MKTPVPGWDYTRWAGDSRPLDRPPLLPGEEERALPGTSVAEIHAYPLRPPGFEEPLFPTPDSRRAVAEHLLEAPWLCRASELRGRRGESVHASMEPVKLRRSEGRVDLVRLRRGGRCSWRKRRVVEILARWREVGAWWDDDLHVDRVVLRALLSGGGVVDLEREGSGWLLVGVVD